VGTVLTIREGREAVQRRGRLRGSFLSDLDADAVSDALGHDPLLIALHEPTEQANPELVIEQFIDSSLARLAAKAGEYTAGEYREALRSMASGMLSHRTLQPSWSALLSWVAGHKGLIPMLRQIVRHGEIIRISGVASAESLAFRHDRVRDALLSQAIGCLGYCPFHSRKRHSVLFSWAAKQQSFEICPPPRLDSKVGPQ
jgi:hypothetical protein